MHGGSVGSKGVLAHKKTQPPRTLEWDYALGPMVVPGGWRFLIKRGTPVKVSRWRYSGCKAPAVSG